MTLRNPGLALDFGDRPVWKFASQIFGFKHCFRKVVFNGPDNCFHVMRSIAVVDSHNTGEELGSCLESLPGCSVVTGGAIRE